MAAWDQLVQRANPLYLPELQRLPSQMRANEAWARRSGYQDHAHYRRAWKLRREMEKIK
jgi:hypothetical protein